MLKGYCHERGITYGERPSLQVLRAKLMASNADVQTASVLLFGTPERTSMASGRAVPSPADGDGTGSRESDQLYLQYCRAKRAEEARDLGAQRNAQHSELKGMLMSLGQSMANVTGVVQAHASSATVAAQRHLDGLVSISHQQAALRTALDSQGSTLGALRPAKRLKTLGTAATLSRPLAGPTAHSASEAGHATVAKPRTALPDMLFTATMEAELMEARMASSPLAIQLQRIVRLTHVSPGKPGVFGSYVVYGLYECAGREAVEDPAVGAPALMVNKEKQGRMKNIIANKADIYLRHLFWPHTVLPEIFETPAEVATY
eukprot:contig_19130_g4729